MQRGESTGSDRDRLRLRLLKARVTTFYICMLTS